jgi:hypothetical protein
MCYVYAATIKHLSFGRDPYFRVKRLKQLAAVGSEDMPLFDKIYLGPNNLGVP